MTRAGGTCTFVQYQPLLSCLIHRAPSSALCALIRRLPSQSPIPGVSKPTNEPIRLDRIVEPGGGPAMGHAGFYCFSRHFAAIAIEKRKLSTGLSQSALKITPLRVGRPHDGRNVTGQITAGRGSAVAVLALWRFCHSRPSIKADCRRVLNKKYPLACRADRIAERQWEVCAGA